MKSRHNIKPFYLIALTVSLVALVMMILATSALAAPRPLDTHTPLEVAGTVEFVDWVFGDPADEYVADGNYYSPGHVLTWQLDGDLEGTYVEYITYIWPLDGSGVYLQEGTATFEGTILGMETSWTADVEGAGLMDYSDPVNHPFKGEDSWTSTLTGSKSPLSHMRGSIVIAGVFDEPWSSGPYTYTGTLNWQTGKKN